MAEIDEKVQQGTPAQASDNPAAPITSEDAALLEQYAHTFTGTYSHSLDGKGRLVVPLAFRDQLGERFCIAPSFDFQSISLYPELAWVKMRDRYAKLGAVNSAVQTYLQWVDSLSYRDQECDGQGRVLMPSRIRQMLLGDEKDVDIAGSGDHVRVVASASAASQFESFRNDLPNLLSLLNGLQ